MAFFFFAVQFQEAARTELRWIIQPAKGATSIARLNQTKAQLKRFCAIRLFTFIFF